MRNALLLSAMLLGFGSLTFAADANKYGAPDLLVVHHGTGAIQIGAGDTPIDKRAYFNCLSGNGCVITARVALNLRGAASTATSVNVYVDGKIIRPEGVATGLRVL